LEQTEDPAKFKAASGAALDRRNRRRDCRLVVAAESNSGRGWIAAPLPLPGQHTKRSHKLDVPFAAHDAGRHDKVVRPFGRVLFQDGLNFFPAL
jgi:hypothetical protein